MGLSGRIGKTGCRIERISYAIKYVVTVLNIPETVINYIAENVNESVRELEGIINSLLAQSIIFKRDVDLDLAEKNCTKNCTLL